MEKTVHILVGGIGTGKSKFATKLSQEQGIKAISADEIQENNEQLSGIEVENSASDDIDSCLKNQESFIIDGKNISPRSRHGLIAKCKKQGYRVYGYNFGKGDVTSLLRRKHQPRQVTDEDWEETHESDSKSYEEPYPDEGFDRIFYPPFNL